MEGAYLPGPRNAALFAANDMLRTRAPAAASSRVHLSPAAERTVVPLHGFQWNMPNRDMNLSGIG